MEANTVISVVVAVILTAAIGLISWRSASKKQAQEMQALLDRTRQLEKELHIKERDFLAERNQREIATSDALRNARDAGYEEGRKLGVTERSAAHVSELSEQRFELTAKFEQEKIQAVNAALDRLRSDYELQSKLFSVKIVPYVSIAEVKGLIRNSYQTITGYQYQLLVNGIPAFAPHVVAEQTEVRKEINSHVERALIETAERAANGAIDLYLGGSTQFAKIAAPVLKRLPSR
jgi:hypothetical protein